MMPCEGRRSFLRPKPLPDLGAATPWITSLVARAVLAIDEVRNATICVTICRALRRLLRNEGGDRRSRSLPKLALRRPTLIANPLPRLALRRRIPHTANPFHKLPLRRRATHRARKTPKVALKRCAVLIAKSPLVKIRARKVAAKFQSTRTAKATRHACLCRREPQRISRYCSTIPNACVCQRQGSSSNRGVAHWSVQPASALRSPK